VAHFASRVRLSVAGGVLLLAVSRDAEGQDARPPAAVETWAGSAKGCGRVYHYPEIRSTRPDWGVMVGARLFLPFAGGRMYVAPEAGYATLTIVPAAVTLGMPLRGQDDPAKPNGVNGTATMIKPFTYRERREWRTLEPVCIAAATACAGWVGSDAPSNSRVDRRRFGWPAWRYSRRNVQAPVRFGGDGGRSSGQA
jgi:hypothetical protein